ncbi:unnamed protein product [Leuciscus chuanchicus]
MVLKKKLKMVTVLLSPVTTVVLFTIYCGIVSIRDPNQNSFSPSLNLEIQLKQIHQPTGHTEADGIKPLSGDENKLVGDTVTLSCSYKEYTEEGVLLISVHKELKTHHGKSNLATGWSSRLKSQCSSEEKAHLSLFHSIMLLCALVILSVLAGDSLGDLITSHGPEKEAQDEVTM